MQKQYQAYRKAALILVIFKIKMLLILDQIWIEVPNVEDRVTGHGVENVQGEVGHRALLEIPQLDH
jgi:hypothetical protein